MLFLIPSDEYSTPIDPENTGSMFRFEEYHATATAIISLNASQIFS